MNAFEKMIHFLQAEAEAPETFGVFHIIAFAVIMVAAVLLCLKFRDCDAKTYRRIVLVAWIVMVICEIYRELVFSMEVEDGVAVWDYAWYQFPFQLCATPLYVFPLVALLPEGKLHDAVMFYVATFAFFGGLVVCIYPGDVFCDYIGINYQSLLHHGLQVIIGALTIVYNRNRYLHKHYFYAVAVFAALLSVALVLDVVGYHVLVSNGMDDTFNMFFISPYFECTLPILDTVYTAVPYPVFLAIYVLGFMLVSAIIFYTSRFIINKAGSAKCSLKTKAA
ncbi:MAG: YwaF family protein [Clostridia bacterium]|nr:YwaF family protein [Clostridia bacterium]